MASVIFIAHLAEQGSPKAEAPGSNPFASPILFFFSGPINCDYKYEDHISISYNCIPAVQINFISENKKIEIEFGGRS